MSKYPKGMDKKYGSGTDTIKTGVELAAVESNLELWIVDSLKSMVSAWLSGSMLHRHLKTGRKLDGGTAVTIPTDSVSSVTS